jgi:hypothetical protein
LKLTRKSAKIMFDDSHINSSTTSDNCNQRCERKEEGHYRTRSSEAKHANARVQLASPALDVARHIFLMAVGIPWTF